MYGTVGATPVAGTATSTGVVYIPPSGANVTTMQQPSFAIEIDWRKNPRVQISQTIVIESAEEAQSFIGSND